MQFKLFMMFNLIKSPKWTEIKKICFKKAVLRFKLKIAWGQLLVLDKSKYIGHNQGRDYCQFKKRDFFVKKGKFETFCFNWWNVLRKKEIVQKKN